MVKATFLDFYGTVVHEDGDIVKKITKIIMETVGVTAIENLLDAYHTDYFI